MTTAVFTELSFAGCHHWLVPSGVVARSAEFRAIADFVAATFGEALQLFQELGTPLWVQLRDVRTRADLGRVMSQ